MRFIFCLSPKMAKWRASKTRGEKFANAGSHYLSAPAMRKEEILAFSFYISKAQLSKAKQSKKKCKKKIMPFISFLAREQKERKEKAGKSNAKKATGRNGKNKIREE